MYLHSLIVEYADAQLVPKDGKYADAQHTHIAARSAGTWDIMEEIRALVAVGLGFWPPWQQEHGHGVGGWQRETG